MNDDQTDAVRQFEEDNPLVVFSVYLGIQGNYVRLLGKEILVALDAEVIDGRPIYGRSLNEIHASFWFWILGAYEVLRTCNQYKMCFSAEAAARIRHIKLLIAPIRVRFSKHLIPRDERSSKGPDVPDHTHFFSISSVTSGDFWFRVGEKDISIRETIGAFEGLVSSLRIEDIVGSLRDFYAQESVK